MKLIGKRLKRLQLPHFLGLGAQKGGTTSLQKLLEHHQDVFLPHCKEVQYFSQHSDKPITWYAEHYAKGRKKRRGDITPFYLFHPQAAERQKFITNCPNDSFVRDPVERAISRIPCTSTWFRESGDWWRLWRQSLSAYPQEIFTAFKHSYIAFSLVYRTNRDENYLRKINC